VRRASMKKINYARIDVPTFYADEGFFDVVCYYLEDDYKGEYEIEEIEEGICSVAASGRVDLKEIIMYLREYAIPYDHFVELKDRSKKVKRFRPEKVDGYIEVEHLRKIVNLPQEKLKHELQKILKNPKKVLKPLKEYNTY
jgi:hypothetical protein